MFKKFKQLVAHLEDGEPFPFAGISVAVVIYTVRLAVFLYVPFFMAMLVGFTSLKIAGISIIVNDSLIVTDKIVLLHDEWVKFNGFCIAYIFPFYVILVFCSAIYKIKKEQ